jgi:hypothetical protein
MPTIGQNYISGKIIKKGSTDHFSLYKIEVLLLGSAGQVVDYTYTDINGSFHFNNIGMGQYNLYCELTGYGCTPLPINFSKNNDTIKNIQVTVNNLYFASFFENFNQTYSSLVKIYPNPSSGGVFVNSNLKGKVAIEVMNNLGTLVYENELIADENQPIELDFAHFSSGIYFIRIKAFDNKSMEVGKIIIQ